MGGGDGGIEYVSRQISLCDCAFFNFGYCLFIYRYLNFWNWLEPVVKMKISLKNLIKIENVQTHNKYL